ncbi:hypothetical protein C7I85_29055 [Mesorhizobium soli]|uniref:Uncharacterized protein n=1 Tax=Pseudaminobacter soli (ex Li et al. 2025) TaxID=1295366 RepID=A0A2P7RPT6_9HYPH|nr:hypothetical protein C7I85_29055 [Mesorhizobium soli]
MLSIGALAGASAFAAGISSSLPDNGPAVGTAGVASKTLPTQPMAGGQIWNHSCLAEACKGKFEPAVLILKPSDSTTSGLQFVRGGFGGFHGGGGGFHGFGGGGFHGFGGGFHGFGGGFHGFGGGFHGMGGFHGFGGFPGMGGFHGFRGMGFHGFRGMGGFHGFHSMAGFRGMGRFHGFHGMGHFRHARFFHRNNFFFNGGNGWDWGWYGFGLPLWYAAYCDPYTYEYYGTCYPGYYSGY